MSTSVNADQIAPISERDDRAPAISDDNHQTILANFADLSVTQTITHQKQNISKTHHATDPYADQEITALLSRLYPVETISWTNQASGTGLVTMDFPNLLFNATNLSRLSRFRYFRSAVEVSIRLNTTSFNKGLLLVSWVPHFAPTALLDNSQSVFRASLLDHAVISADSQDTLTFTIPYVAPSAYMNLQSTEVNFFGLVHIHVLVPLTNPNGPSALATVQVYARFLEPQVAGPYHTQGDNGGRPPGIPPDKLIVKSAEDPTNKANRRADAENEAIVRSRMQVSSDIAQAKTATTPYISESKIGKMVEKFIDVAPKFIGAILPALLLDRPTSEQMTENVHIVPNSCFAHVNGLDPAQMLAANSSNKIAVTSEIFNCARDYNAFSAYKKLPTLISIKTIAYNTAIDSVLDRWYVSPMNVHHESGGGGEIYYPTHLSHLTSLFAAWRGSIKYRIHFVCTHFTSARIRIEWIPEMLSDVTVTPTQVGDHIHKVVDVNGDTVVDFEVPYLKPQQWAYTTNYLEYDGVATPDPKGYNGVIRLSLVTAIANSASTTSGGDIGYCVWVAAGDSYQLAFPVDSVRAIDATGNFTTELYETQGDRSFFSLRDAFEKPFDGLVQVRTQTIGGFSNAEDIHSFSEYLKRSVRNFRHAQNITTGVTNVNSTIYFDSTQSQAINRILTSFLFQRGSFRVRQILVTTATSGNVFYQPAAFSYYRYDDDAQQGIYMHDHTKSVTAEVQVPFYYEFPMWAHDLFASEQVSPPALLEYTDVTPITLQRQYVAVGDDFTMNWPIGPVPILVTPVE